MFNYLNPSNFKSFMGLSIQESPDVSKYILPAEIMPGIPWPPGFRAEINKWSREFLGTTNYVPPGRMYMLYDKVVVMNPRDIVKLMNTCI